MIQLTAADPFPIQVVKQRPDGTGVVRIPIMRTGTVDLALTATPGGKGSQTITREHLAAAVENFKRWPGPIPINVHPHRKESSGKAPAALRAMHLEGDAILGDIDVTASLFAELVGPERGWFGYSPEYYLDGVRHASAGTFDSTVITGGVFTNGPATDLHFRVDASAPDLPAPSTQFIHLAAPDGPPEEEMPENKVPEVTPAQLTAALEAKTAAEAKVTALEGQVAELTTKLKAATSGDKDAQIVALTAQVETLATKVGQFATVAQEAKQTSATTQLAGVITTALDAGTPATLFEGYDQAPDKLAWLTGAYGSLSVLETVIQRTPKLKRTPTTSGKANSADAESGATALHAMAAKLASEKSVTFSEAIDIIKREQPAVYEAGTSAYRE